MKLQKILVSHNGTPGADELVRLACETVASTDGGIIIVLAVTPIHPSLPLTGLPISVDSKAAAALQRAKVIAADCTCPIECRLRHARDAAHSIVRESIECEVDAVFMPLDPPRFHWMAPRPSRTARYVMREAACPVILSYAPAKPALNERVAVVEAERILHGARYY